jgi:hypothetical protein
MLALIVILGAVLFVGWKDDSRGLKWIGGLGLALVFLYLVARQPGLEELCRNGDAIACCWQEVEPDQRDVLCPRRR